MLFLYQTVARRQCIKNECRFFQQPACVHLPIGPRIQLSTLLLQTLLDLFHENPYEYRGTGTIQIAESTLSNDGD
jgi:hypothetical protein